MYSIFHLGFAFKKIYAKQNGGIRIHPYVKHIMKK